MREAVARLSHALRRNHRLMRDPAEREDDAQSGHRGDSRGEEPTACLDLPTGGLVGRRHAAHGIGDHAIDEAQTVLRRGAVPPRREPRLDQCGVEQLPGVIAGERPARPVRALQPRREPDNEQPAPLIAE
jgi:hypothetical protein